MPRSLAFSILLLAVVAAIRLPAQDPIEREGAVSVRLMFGLDRLTPERWDGSIAVSEGRVLGLSGVHFEGRDAITGPDSWLLTNRVTRYVDSRTPRGYDPVHTRLYAMIPNGVVATLDASPDARVEVDTVMGRFEFRLSSLPLGRRLHFLDRTVSAERIPTTVDLTGDPAFDDYPAIAFDRDGTLWASWISYAAERDRVLVARRTGSGWSEPEQVSPAGYGDNFRTALARDPRDRVCAVWSGKRAGAWGLYSRCAEGDGWSAVETLAGEAGPNLYHAVARDARGRIHVSWQGFRDGVSEVLHRRWDGEEWSAERVVSSGLADKWSPAIAADSSGGIWIGWDGYQDGDFNVYVRRMDAEARLEKAIQVTRSPAFDANVSLACDRSDRLWIGWDYGEANWGKDWTSQRFKPGGGAGLYRSRHAKIAVLSGGVLLQPKQPLMDAVPERYRDYVQQARLIVDDDGAVWAMMRSLTSATTRVNNNWGAGGRWEVLLSRLDAGGWTEAVRLDRTSGRNDVWARAAAAEDGSLWFAWSRDGRPFGAARPHERGTPPPGVTEVSYTRIDPSQAAWAGAGSPELAGFSEAPLLASPVHPNEASDVAAIRAYRVEAAGRKYRILRGDLHRHTDISNDGIGDGSLRDFYRYALTAGQYDFMMVADHQYGGSGAGLEYNWWRTEKSEDIYLVKDRFWPLFGTERSLKYPNGHRNTVFAKRGVRELPTSADERMGQLNTGAVLYPYLRQNGGIATSHTSGTNQGTDWRDSDPELEPIVEIYQGLHASYEYIGAPRAETEDKRYFHHDPEWRPKGFVWEAWKKGLKLGVQASSDHIATHDAYACVLVEDGDRIERQDLIDAMKARHTYAATDNIIVDFRIGDHIMGDAFRSAEVPRIRVRAVGTRPLSRIVLIKNNELIYTHDADAAEAEFEYRDQSAEPGESYYYVRVEQSDGSLAWASPIWVDFRP